MQIDRRRWVWLAVALGVGASGVAAAWGMQLKDREERQRAFTATVPSEGRPGGYVSSNTCQGCHPAEHASWHQSYHRTMTQFASSDTVKGPFAGVPPLPVHDGKLHLYRQGNEYRVRLEANPGAAAIGSPTDWRVGMLTGSHHLQLYWMSDGAGNRMQMLPYAYLLGPKRWVPARDTFLADPHMQWRFDIWNTQCLQCHVTAGQSRPEPDGKSMMSRMAETGIACESCHGPAQAHVARMQNPIVRYGAHLGLIASSEIVNPKKLAPRESSEVCGQCHGIFGIAEDDRFLQEGFGYRPGQSLRTTKVSLRPDLPEAAPFLTALKAQDPRFVDSSFWPDGMVRVTGREWTAMQRSACHARGTMTCLSCHSMHRSDPNDMLSEGAEGNQACVGCHANIVKQPQVHTHHVPGSSGSLCYNCHMPHTTYGLLKAIRSHEIENPSVTRTIATGRPNGCAQCHLDRPLGWTGKYLTAWYGQKNAPLSSDEETVASAVLWALSGDAAQRALVAWSLGWDAARATSGGDWQAAFLVLALTDSYAAVRHVAEKSLRSFSGFSNIDYDYAAPSEVIEKQVALVIKRWAQVRAKNPDAERGMRLLLKPDGSLDRVRVSALLEKRNERSLELKE